MGKTFRITVNSKPYAVEVGDLSKSPIEVIVDGEVFQVELQDEGHAVTTPAVAARPATSGPKPSPRAIEPVPQPARGSSAPPPVAAGKHLAAPMPGTVLAVKVKEGDRVKHGQEVCIVESMKMELNIMATADGVVKKVYVAVGQSVVHGTILVEFE
jgi:glutaconyl-CoA/methylmalonyl-CoA decarboxylase subunit gamma